VVFLLTEFPLRQQNSVSFIFRCALIFVDTYAHTLIFEVISIFQLRAQSPKHRMEQRGERYEEAKATSPSYSLSSEGGKGKKDADGTQASCWNKEVVTPMNMVDPPVCQETPRKASQI
jgi:hypothetical protein